MSKHLTAKKILSRSKLMKKTETLYNCIMGLNKECVNKKEEIRTRYTKGHTKQPSTKSPKKQPKPSKKSSKSSKSPKRDLNSYQLFVKTNSYKYKNMSLVDRMSNISTDWTKFKDRHK
ncbi:MAG: hypothetical protein ACW98X_12200 [Promethearchaeota archaeon]|jgi:hypothetical protein